VKNVTTRVTLDEKNMARERGLKEWIEGGWGWGQTETEREREGWREADNQRNERRGEINAVTTSGLYQSEG